MAPVLLRPKRLTITVSGAVFQHLEHQSTAEGRSLSNLAAFLLEWAMNHRPSPAPLAPATAAPALDYLGSPGPY